ncbi:MAG: choice-of-anchor Q domain-containing protein [Chloroflexota bacterium]
MLIAAVLAVALLALAGGRAPTYAGSNGQLFHVTRDDDPAPNGCADDDCSLREAIVAANQDAVLDVIMIPPMHITLTRAGSDTEAAVGALDITHDVIIEGANPEAPLVAPIGPLPGSTPPETIIDAGGLNGIFDVNAPNFPAVPDVAVLVKDVTLTGTQNGPAIYSNASDFTIDRVIINDNHNNDDGGGVEANLGTVTIKNSTISNNTSDESGGGLDVRNLVIENSTVLDNIAGEVGGGIAAEGITMTNTTVFGNLSGAQGGGVFVGANLTDIARSTISYSTFSSNDSGDGSAVLAFGNPLTLANSILWGDDDDECSGTITGVNNILETKSGCAISGTVITQDPMLGTLRSYIGQTPTLPISVDSPALDAATGDCPVTDQRGIPRPQGEACDIGAFEYMHVGDVNCSGTVELQDLLAELGYIAGISEADCLYRGDIDCSADLGGLDGLFILRHIANLTEQTRPIFCPPIGPDTPLT